jgi:Rhodopirellula transposase DDE domain
MAALNYCGGSSRHAETVFGWNRHAVASGIKEAELGVPIQRDVETRGSCLVEVANPELANHVDRLCGNDAQVDPKFQTVTRCWSALERHWNGSILKTIEDVIHWAETMTWKKIRPIVWIQDQVYARGVRLSRSEKKLWSARLNRREGLEPWSLTIEPLPT